MRWLGYLQLHFLLNSYTESLFKLICVPDVSTAGGGINMTAARALQ
jgi:hypothetical protein